jgi:cellulose synthase/poly-beta-1,6-N-acetylglucosamine synthase-like glycosyltransferase
MTSVIQTPTVNGGGTFSIGICASDDAQQLPDLLNALAEESFPPDFVLKEIVVAASGCPEPILSKVRQALKHDTRIVLISESRRSGKVRAVNAIIDRSDSDFLVLTNSDALPLSGSIAKLLKTIDSDMKIGSVSASPTFSPRGGMTGKVLELMWSAHNLSSLRLNHAHISNHNCDELMVVRTNLLSELPSDVVNDGAYIGGLIHSKGYMVNYCESAPVEIDVPDSIYDVIQQRRRILYGHAQVWMKLGTPPRTLETLLFLRSRVALGLLTSIFRVRPRMLLTLPVIAVSEGIASILSLVDRLRLPNKHVVWRRYAKNY